MPIPFSASTAEMPARTPMSEKSSVPVMRIARQPSSRAVTLSGTSCVRQTSERSASVCPEKQNTASRSTSV